MPDRIGQSSRHLVTQLATAGLVLSMLTGFPRIASTDAKERHRDILLRGEFG